MANEGGVLKSLERADLSFCDKASSFLQSDFWGNFKSRFEWEARAFVAEWKCGEETYEKKPLLVLCRRFIFGFSLAYVPWGPELPFETSHQSAIKELAFRLKEMLPKNTVLVRFDLPWTFDGLPEIGKPFIRAAVDVQAPDTVIIDLTQPFELLKEQMKPKWRYNAGLALRKGVKVYLAGEEKLDSFYGLLQETARRDGISIHSREYYKTIFSLSSSVAQTRQSVRLYLAEHAGDTIAGIITLFRGANAVYLYGASSNNKRNLMAPYAIQLKAMEDAKEYGCAEYDLYGIPPTEDPNHPMAGLYRFKTGFGGKIIHRSGCWDFPCKKVLYFAYRYMEKARKKIMLLKKIYSKH